jgi:hypothetical protein
MSGVIGAGFETAVPALPIMPADAHVGFGGAAGAIINGQAQPDTRKSVLIAAGSLGSQLAINLAREGSFSWTVVDPDSLRPHNLARHALYPVARPRYRRCCCGQLAHMPAMPAATTMTRIVFSLRRWRPCRGALGLMLRGNPEPL